MSNCGSDEPGEVIDLDVEEYIMLLKKNFYAERLLPAFSQKNIPALLSIEMKRRSLPISLIMVFLPFMSLNADWVYMCYGPLNRSAQ